MLNYSKKISYKNQKIIKKKIFWKIPNWSKSRFQLNNNTNQINLGGMPTIFAPRLEKVQKKWRYKKKKFKILKHKKLRFFYNSSIFNSLFLFKKFPKIKIRKYKTINIKRNLLFLQHLIRLKNHFKGYFKSYSLRVIKGGRFASVLGFRSFMPKSHSKLILTTNLVPSTRLLSLKFCKRRRRFSTKKRIHLNIVSSSKPKHKLLQLEEKLYLKKKLEKTRLLKIIKFKKKNLFKM